LLLTLNGRGIEPTIMTNTFLIQNPVPYINLIINWFNMNELQVMKGTGGQLFNFIVNCLQKVIFLRYKHFIFSFHSNKFLVFKRNRSWSCQLANWFCIFLSLWTPFDSVGPSSMVDKRIQYWRLPTKRCCRIVRGSSRAKHGKIHLLEN
jgi:hypothetical protein